MFVTPGKLTMLHKGRLPIGFFHVKRTDVQPFCFSVALGNFMDSNRISLPINVDTAKTTRFSSTVTRAHSYISSINITTYNSFNAVLGSLSFCKDPLVQSYDFFGLISLSSAMRSNVPMPFRGLNKFSHLKMPGGQCSEEYKFIAQNLEFSHNSGLRNCLQADRATYQNAFLDSNGKGFTKRRSYSTQSTPPNSPTTKSAQSNWISKESFVKLNKRERLKKAFKKYGASIVAFHVGMSLISLGSFYVLISSGINLVPVMEFFGIASPTIAEKVATGSTFVVAYAVHKVFAPARVSITLAAIPFIIRYLRSKGVKIPKTKNNI
nr:uncharacterized protein LOC108019295 isoform X1 [Drosophila suzukii]